MSLTADATARGATVQVGGIALDPDAQRVWRGGREVRLGPTEVRILELLLANPSAVFSRAEIIRSLWGNASAIEERTVDAHIARMRKALARRSIRTIRGRGYALGEA